MKTHIALLRAVNVGGTGRLPMAELRKLCATAGFEQVQTYIASGNVVLRSPASASEVKAALERSLAEYAGKAVGVFVRSPAEMTTVLAQNPFPHAAAKHTVAIFLDRAPPANTLESMRGQKDEQVALGKREIYVHYGTGMGQSKLNIPAAKQGTARNMNTLAKLIEMASPG